MTSHGGENVEQGEHSSITVGIVNCAAFMEISMAVLQKIWNWSTLRCSYSTLGHLPKGHRGDGWRTWGEHDRLHQGSYGLPETEQQARGPQGSPPGPLCSRCLLGILGKWVYLWLFGKLLGLISFSWFALSNFSIRAFTLYYLCCFSCLFFFFLLEACTFLKENRRQWFWGK